MNAIPAVDADTLARSGDTVTAVVLAGGDASDRIAREAGVDAKALLPIGDRPMGAYVLAALRDCGAVRTIVYVGAASARLAPTYDVRVEAGARFVDSLALGLGAAMAVTDGDPRARFLLLGADVPWVTGAMLDRFLAAASTLATAHAESRTGPDLVYPVVPRDAAEAQFPHQRRTFVRLRDGSFTGGNVVLVRASVVARLLPLIDRVHRARKNPAALAAIVGWDVLFSLLLGTASIAALERRVSRLLDAPARALVTTDAAIAADVDRPAHVPGTAQDAMPGPAGSSGPASVSPWRTS
ncbi:MAG: NTP transferase domain-containing protein [Trueperaceae bacterium]